MPEAIISAKGTEAPTVRSGRFTKYYEDMSTPQPLPKLECEDTILAILQNEN